MTGASSGIGRACAVKLGQSGCTVLVHYRNNESGADETVSGVEGLGARATKVQADLGEATDVEKLFSVVEAREGRLDVLVNNAGDPLEYREFDAYTPELWDRVIAANLRSVFLCCQAACRLMRARQWGRIVNVTSIGALEGGSPGTLPYATAKGGIETLTRGLARLVGRDGITVNAVAPGSIRTGMQERFLDPRQIAAATERTAVGRGGEAEEVAAAVVFLASPEAGFITGEVLRVDGGRSA